MRAERDELRRRDQKWRAQAGEQSAELEALRPAAAQLVAVEECVAVSRI
jgi:hypothetical protein